MRQSARIARVVTAIAVTLAATATAADAPTLVAPRSAAMGAAVSISATGLKPGFFYRATLDQAPADKTPGMACVRNIDQPFRVGHADRTYVWRGRVPTTLRCRNTHTDKFARVVALKPGTYRWIVGHKVGRAAWDTHATLLVQRVRITKAAAR